MQLSPSLLGGFLQDGGGKKSRAEKMACYPEDLRFDGDGHVEGRRAAAGSVFLEEPRL